MLKALAVVIVLIFVAVGAVLIALQTDWGRNQVRERVERTLAARFPGARVAKIDGSIFSALVVRGIDMDTPQGHAHVGELRLHVSLLSLLHRLLRVDTLELDDVDLQLAENSSPAPQPTPPADSSGGGGSSGWTIEVPALEIHRAHVRRGPVDIQNIEVAGSAQLLGDDVVAILAAHGAWQGHVVTATLIASYLDSVVHVPLLAIDAGDGARIAGVGLTVRDRGKTLEGALGVHVLAKTANELAGVELPGDFSLSFGARVGGYGELDLSLGERRVRATAKVDISDRLARGVFVVEDPKLGLAMIAGDVSPTRVHGIASGEVEGNSVVASVDVTPTGGWVVLGGKNAHGHGSAYVELAHDHDKWTIGRAHAVMRANEFAGAHGDLYADLRVKGTAWPDPELSFEGEADIANATFGSFAARHIHLALDGWRQVPVRTRGDVRIDLDGIQRAGAPVGDASLEVRVAAPQDGPIGVEVEAPKLALANGTKFTASNIRITTDDARKRIDVVGQLASNNGSAALRGSYTRATSDFTFKLDAKDLPLALVRPDIQGTVAGSFAVGRTSGRWNIASGLRARGAVISGKAVDGDVDVKLAGSRLTLAAQASTAFAAGRVELDVDGPRDITDVAAWRALDRRALHQASLAIDHFELGGIGGIGSVAGELALDANDAHGTMTAHGIATPHGAVDGSVTFAPAPGHDIAASFTGALASLVHADGVARLGLPDHPFDPDEWADLGASALRSIDAKVHDFTFDSSKLATLGVIAPYQGHASATLAVGSGANSLTSEIRVHGLRGGPLVRPVDNTTTVTIDRRGMALSVSTQAHSREIVALAVHAPIAPLDLLTPDVVRHAPVTGTIDIRDTPARLILALFDRGDVTSGTVGGKIEVSGTIGTPIARAIVAAHGIVVPPGIAGRKPATLSELAVDATWGGEAGRATVTGMEEGGGSLTLIASGGKSDPAAVRVSLDAKHFDLAPLATFAPGPLVAASGTLDASIEVNGIDPATGDVQGQLHLHDARMPLSGEVGTVHKANLDVTIARRVVSAKLAAKLGNGDITGSASLALAAAKPTTADFDLDLRKIGAIAALEPVITANVHGHFTYGAGAGADAARMWIGDVAIDHGLVTIPSTERSPLLPTGAPADLLFADAPPPITKQAPRKGPAHPYMVTHVKLGATEIDAENLRDVANGHVVIAGNVEVKVGADGVGVDGEIDHQSGDIEILGREYQVERGTVVFDGGLDPELNVRIVHDFQDVTLIAEVHGRAASPEMALSSDPNVYSDSQLLGFFLGGEPGGDPSTASKDAAAGAGAAVLSTKLGARLKHVLPVHLDVLSYEAATGKLERGHPCRVLGRAQAVYPVPRPSRGAPRRERQRSRRRVLLAAQLVPAIDLRRPRRGWRGPLAPVALVAVSSRAARHRAPRPS